MQLTEVGTLSDGYGSQLAFAANGATWASAATGVAYVWEGKELRHSVNVPGYRGGPIVFDPAPPVLRVGSWAIDIESGEAVDRVTRRDLYVAHFDLESTVRPNDFSVRASAPTPDGQRMIVATAFAPPRGKGATSSYDGPRGQLLLVDLDANELVAVLDDDTGTHAGLVLLATMGQVGSAGRRLAIWEALSGTPIASDDQTAAMATDAVLNTDGSRLAITRIDGRVELRRSGDLSTMAAWEAHPKKAVGCAFHPTLPLLVTGGADQQLKVWSIDGASPKLVGWHWLADGVGGLAMHPFGEHVLVATDDDEIVVVAIDA